MSTTHSQYYNEIFDEIKKWLIDQNPFLKNTGITMSSVFVVDLKIDLINGFWLPMIYEHLLYHFGIKNSFQNTLQVIKTIEDLVDFIDRQIIKEMPVN